MMRLLTLLLATFALFTHTSRAQSRVFRGRVVDSRNAGIPFAVIEAKEQHTGVYTDENGYFAFTGDAAAVKTLVVFCLGFEQKELEVAALPQDSILVTLQPKTMTLKPVQITARDGRRREGILGRSRRKLHHDGDCYRYYGSETAIKLAADTGQYEATLKAVYVYITKEGDPATYFKVHVYEWGPLPANEMTDTNIVARAGKGGKWVKIDLSDRHIRVGDGLFVSVEWVSGFGNTEQALSSAYNPAVTHYNGQVLGITDGYGQPSITYSRKPFSRTWEYYDDPGAPRKGGYFLNPMIYCTYSYVK